MEIKNLLSKGLFYGLFAFAGLLVVGCTEEPVAGCLDSNSETYNPDADENDPSLCVYARDKFIGSYTGSLICTGGLAGAINNPTYEFSIEESASGGVQDVSINLVVFGAPSKIAGSVSGNDLNIDQTIENVPFTLPTGDVIMVNVIASGSATITGNDLSGDVIIGIKSAASGATILPDDTCPITGTKS